MTCNAVAASGRKDRRGQRSYRHKGEHTRNNSSVISHSILPQFDMIDSEVPNASTRIGWLGRLRKWTLDIRLDHADPVVNLEVSD